MFFVCSNIATATFHAYGTAWGTQPITFSLGFEPKAVFVGLIARNGNNAVEYAYRDENTSIGSYATSITFTADGFTFTNYGYGGSGGSDFRYLACG